MENGRGQMAAGLISEDLTFHGQITGDARVAAGARLVLHGQVAGTLTIEEGGSAVIHGMVGRDVVNRGDVDVRGMVIGRLIDESGRAVVAPRAVVGTR